MDKTVFINNKAVFSFIAAILAVISLCVGILPIPFLELICYPFSLVLGIAAIVLGLWAQYEVRVRGEGGKMLAVIAVWLGVFTLIALACLIWFLVTIIPRIYENLMQYLNQYDLNPF
jgi:hypothetical protein